MKRVLLTFSLLYCGIGYISDTNANVISSSKLSIEFRTLAKRPLDLDVWWIPACLCVPSMAVMYDPCIPGDFNAAYSAALDYMLIQAGGR